ncbi:MAG: glycosyl hydrolase family 18 protein [Candidatus Campbellbacteria bacterium]|nr:glycosyl hydrolase family 18 protein [Candidatus Campbellbacteria bacterium]
MKKIHSLSWLVVLFCLLLISMTVAPSSVHANTDLKISGWIPYWAVSSGTKDARKNIDAFSAIFPFNYSVKSDGSLLDLGKIKQSAWKKLFTVAKKKDVLVIPTVMWSNTGAIYTVLNNPNLRAKHIGEIVTMVKKQKFDGVDIDYEGKSAETYTSFALFLKELKKKLGKRKVLSCTIEARTPPDSLYKTIPTDLRYANDYNAIAKYCDRVNIMTYDQQRADLKLNDAHVGEAYIPMSDPAWVRKVIELTLQTIPKEKISLGVPTYGHEYEVIVRSGAYQEYGKTGAFNPSYGIKTAKQYGITPERSDAGELSFTFSLLPTAPQFLYNAPIPTNTSSANRVAAQSFAYTKATGLASVFYYATWSDAEAIRQKIELAREYGLAGIALFKIDGNEDSAMWKLFD